LEKNNLVEGEQVKAGKLPKEQLEQAAIDNYIKMANETKGSSFILEVMPTEMQWSTGGAVDKAGGNTGIGDYRVGGDVAQTRRIAESVSDTIAKKSGQNPDSADPEQIKKAKAQVFALMVPYNNGAENIAAHDAKPMDAVENLHNMLGKLDKNVNTVATGYSQGGGAVLEYAHKYGGQDGLDNHRARTDGRSGSVRCRWCLFGKYQRSRQPIVVGQAQPLFQKTGRSGGRYPVHHECR